MLQHGGRTVDGVDDGLAVVGAEGTLQRLEIGGVQLEGLADHALQRLDHLLQHGGLVHLGRAHVDIQKLRARLRLGDGLLQHIVHVVLPQGLLEALFAGGIDALTHHGDAVNGDALHRGADHRGHGMGGPAGYAVAEHVVQKADEVRRGAAAAAGGEETQIAVGGHLLGEQLRRDVVAAAVGPGQARVGLDEHREVAGQGLGQALGHGEDLLGSQRAVDAQRVGTQATGGGGKALHRAASEGAAPCLEAHAGQHREVTVLLDGQQGGLQLVEIGESLHHHQIGTGGHTGPNNAGVFADGSLEGESAVGLQQLAQGADVQGGQRAVRGAGPLAAGHACGDDLLHGIGAFCQLVGRRAEGIGVDDAAARGGVHAVDPLDGLGVGDVQLLGPGAELETGGLQHGAHAAVQQDGVGLVEKVIDLHR